jgi:hypothetical protein
MRRATAIAASAVLALATATTAAAAGGGGSLFVFGITGPGRPLSFEFRNIPARVTGDLVVRFHGDAAAGCAVRGLCRYSGTIVWTPPHAALLDVSGITTRRGTGYSFDLLIGGFANDNGGPMTNADTQNAAAPAAVCADAAYTGSDLSFPVANGRARVGLTGSDLFGTRCAGPQQGDLSAALPSTTVPLLELMRGQRTLKLTGDRPFVSHGFAGTVSSTLSIALGRARRWHRSKLRTTNHRERDLTITYRATLQGDLVASVNGDSAQGLCGPLGACGVTGTVALHPRAVGEAELTAAGSTTHSWAGLMRALRSGREQKGVSTYGYINWHGGGSTNTSLGGAGWKCSDSVRLRPGEAELELRHGMIDAQYLGDQSGSEFRTRCPGPYVSKQPLATGRAPISIIGRPTATIPLTSTAPFSDDGYTGRLSSTVKIRLSQPRIERHTVTEFESSG